MKIKINPSIAKGTVNAPPSKSMAHRLLICAGLSNGCSKIQNLAYSEDIKATIDCLRSLGANIELDGDTATVYGIPKVDKLEATLNCRESGSTLRFFIPICLLSYGKKTLNGSQTLLTRPLSIYEDLFKNKGIALERGDGNVSVCGNITPLMANIPGNISSQFITGLLFVLPLLNGDSTIKLIPPVESRSYIDMTILSQKQFGVDVVWKDETTLYIKGNQAYHSKTLCVEGDYSNAAFLDAFNLIGGDVNVNGLLTDSLQGDKIYKSYYDNLKNGNTTIDISNCPDLGPILIAMAALLHGATINGTKRLKIKESDRGNAMRAELLKFGIDISVEDNSIVVPDDTLTKPTQTLSGHNDHRIVMSLAVIASQLGGEIEESEAVKKSFPDFFDVISKLGIDIQECTLDKCEEVKG